MENILLVIINFDKPVGAIPKLAGCVRLIHDCNWPVCNALNGHATLDCSYKFETLDDDTSVIRQGYYMAKVDLKSAYHSGAISKESQQYTGLTFELDGRLDGWHKIAFWI